MRALERVVIRAFVDGKPCKVGITMATTNGRGCNRLLLRLGDAREPRCIAVRKPDGSIWATLAGWPTHATRSRLNALCEALGLRFTHFAQVKGKQVLQSREREGRFAGLVLGESEITDDEWIRLT